MIMTEDDSSPVWKIVLISIMSTFGAVLLVSFLWHQYKECRFNPEAYDERELNGVAAPVNSRQVQGTRYEQLESAPSALRLPAGQVTIEDRERAWLASRAETSEAEMSSV